MKNFFIYNCCLFFFSINKICFALIKVDITRGNLDPLPIAVSPLHVESNSEKIENIEVKKLGSKNFRNNRN